MLARARQLPTELASLIALKKSGGAYREKMAKECRQCWYLDVRPLVATGVWSRVGAGGGWQVCFA